MANKENTTPETTEVPKRELLEYHSPAAEIAAAKGEETKVYVIPERFPGDNVRRLCVNSNPACVLPTGEPVEVALDEYNELRRSEIIRKANKKESDKLARKFHEIKKYL